MNREKMLKAINERKDPWDLIVIGGGATGVGIAVDGASRGYKVLLLEQSDFGKGTSSRSTKLVHGGVRYLEQGNISLVMESLRERGILRQNAPHLVSDLSFIVPNYEWWQAPFYGIGLKIYNALAGKYGFGKSQILSREETLERLPTIKTEGLRSGVMYYDGQFDDARLLINLVTTAVEQGAVAINYFPVTGLLNGEDGFVAGVQATDLESGKNFEILGKVVINATGVFCDNVRRLSDPTCPPLVTASQGVHLVLDRSFLPGDSAMMVPQTADKRVMFAIPWHNHTVLGTTDTPISTPVLDPLPLEEEIEFILKTAGEYLAKAPSRSDILSVFTGIRPLVAAEGARPTALIPRDHAIHIDPSGLLTITGGKWTTYRHMAEECVDEAMTLGELEERPCVTKNLPIHGHLGEISPECRFKIYGSDAPFIENLLNSKPELDQLLHHALPYRAVEIVWAVRYEMARTVEDCLARRTRALFLNAHAALAAAPLVAQLLSQELQRDSSWKAEQMEAFRTVARTFSASSA